MALGCFALRLRLTRRTPILFRPQQPERKPAQIKEIANHSDENDTPEPFLNPMCFRGGSDGREVHGMEWRGREQNNNSEIVGWQVRAQAAISWKAGPKAVPQVPAHRILSNIVANLFTFTSI
jgi:hypothetical protein